MFGARAAVKLPSKVGLGMVWVWYGYGMGHIDLLCVCYACQLSLLAEI